jgi:hypothetical protein
MKTLNAKVAVASITLVLVFAGVPAAAQSPPDAHHPPAAAPGQGDTPADRDAKPMMEMCHQMMMANPMMGMDSERMPQMLQMRGEMMKAMGEVMMKHGRMRERGAIR